MRFILVSFFFFIAVFGFSQRKAKYTIYKMGRPSSFEKNNAVRDVQSKWRLNFVAVGSGVYSSNMDSLIEENKRTDEALKKKYGNDWRPVLMKEVVDMVKRHNEIRELIVNQLPASPLGENVFVEVDVKNKRKAIVKVFGTKVTDLRSWYITYYKYKIKLKDNSIKLLSDIPEPIDFSYPENDIINR